MPPGPELITFRSPSIFRESSGKLTWKLKDSGFSFTWNLYVSLAWQSAQFGRRRRMFSGYDPCYSNYAQDYFNRKDVQKAFHANVSGLLPGKYQVCRWIDQHLFSPFLHGVIYHSSSRKNKNMSWSILCAVTPSWTPTISRCFRCYPFTPSWSKQGSESGSTGMLFLDYMDCAVSGDGLNITTAQSM
jgi:hypothetical protein